MSPILLNKKILDLSEGTPAFSGLMGGMQSAIGEPVCNDVPDGEKLQYLYCNMNDGAYNILSLHYGFIVEYCIDNSEVCPKGKN